MVKNKNNGTQVQIVLRVIINAPKKLNHSIIALATKYKKYTTSVIVVALVARKQNR